MSELAQMTLNLDGDTRDDEYVNSTSADSKTHLIKMAEKADATNIHFGVKGGGCAGFKYDWSTY